MRSSRSVSDRVSSASIVVPREVSSGQPATSSGRGPSRNSGAGVGAVRDHRSAAARPNASANATITININAPSGVVASAARAASGPAESAPSGAVTEPQAGVSSQRTAATEAVAPAKRTGILALLVRLVPSLPALGRAGKMVGKTATFGTFLGGVGMFGWNAHTGNVPMMLVAVGVAVAAGVGAKLLAGAEKA